MPSVLTSMCAGRMLVLSRQDIYSRGRPDLGRRLQMNTKWKPAMFAVILSSMAAMIALLAPPLSAADTTQAANADELQTITITAAKVRTLEQFTPTGSRLGLSEQELPATLDVIDNDEMLGRGFINVQESADSQAGVISGGSPGDQSQFSMRGFTGNQITTIRNGIYIGPSNMTTRDQNSFNVGSVEILKGPASVLYGQGAVAGVINVVDKAPSFGAPQVEALASSGSYGTTNVGIGGTTHVGDTFAV